MLHRAWSADMRRKRRFASLVDILACATHFRPGVGMREQRREVNVTRFL
jgi:hypothetical protein